MDGTPVKVGERGDFPMVVAKTTSFELQAMTMAGTSCLRSEWPKPWIVVNVETKQRLCAMCEQWKSIYEFGKDASCVLGRGGYCMPCDAAYHREYRRRRAA